MAYTIGGRQTLIRKAGSGFIVTASNLNEGISRDYAFGDIDDALEWLRSYLEG